MKAEMDRDAREAFQQGFPEGAAIPKDLVRLYDYCGGGLVVCDFTVSAAIYVNVGDYFNDNEKMTSRFAGFGRDRFGSLYGYWLHAGGNDLSKAPIGYLAAASKAESSVLANSLPELMALLTVGIRGVGEVENWDELAKLGPCSDLAKYKRWIKKEFGIAPLKDLSDAKAIVERAKQSNPNLQQWINDWVSRRR